MFQNLMRILLNQHSNQSTSNETCSIGNFSPCDVGKFAINLEHLFLPQQCCMMKDLEQHLDLQSNISFQIRLFWFELACDKFLLYTQQSYTMLILLINISFSTALPTSGSRDIPDNIPTNTVSATWFVKYDNYISPHHPILH